MTTVVLLTVTGLGLAALYFLVASGLSLIFGLMGVLNFAHGAFLTIGAYGTWWAAENLPGAGSTGWGFVLAVVFGVAVGALVAALIELSLIRPLYERHIEQVLVTVGLSLALVALVRAIWGPTPAVPAAGVGPADDVGPGRQRAQRPLPADRRRGRGAGRRAGLPEVHPRRPHHPCRRREPIDGDRAGDRRPEGLHAGVRDRWGVRRAGRGAGGIYLGSISPGQGTSLLIFAFIVVVIGGMSSITGTAAAAVLVGLVQQFANYYAASGVGDLSVVLLLAVVLLARPSGLTARLA
ncbi:branched-chain amino acid ABC transporter permease [Blastococcus brunescens]|uniref:Branched-chain amino acid ABC transporter permease n=1 Tax=Blastococcus brunescens TaxID=1564165 RepID=A0ABZ1B0Y4_9ACTN|nr:branched-chain amino acid ABC transporter permease [Blastococcus sp. BMG 8361]WRL63406.1 branched-chain amino acid ABC transporter permease [Blastococcus sp. BMG 8361]